MLLRECAFEGSAPGTRRRNCFIMHMLQYRLATHETLGGLNGYENKNGRTTGHRRASCWREKTNARASVLVRAELLPMALVEAQRLQARKSAINFAPGRLTSSVPGGG